MSVKDDVSLDINALDTEWERQSTLMEEYASALSKSNKEYSQMKLVLDGQIAELKLGWRAKGKIDTLNGEVKLTEGALDNAIDSDTMIIEQRKALIEKQYEVDMLKGIVDALRSKKSALESEVQLYLSGYFSSPKDQRTLIREKQRQ
jgi:hypothetical protein